MGVLAAERAVNPTISEKKMVTMSNASGATEMPLISWEAIDLLMRQEKHEEGTSISIQLKSNSIHIHFLTDSFKNTALQRPVIDWAFFIRMSLLLRSSDSIGDNGITG